MSIRRRGIRRWRSTVGAVVLALLVFGLSGAPPASASPHRPVPAARAAAAPAGSFVPVPPTRLLDTRAGAAIPVGGSVVLTVAGLDGVPATGVASVAFVMTAVRETAAGYLTMYPDGTDRPIVVSVNFAAGYARSNTVLSQLGVAGAVRIYNGATAAANVTVDVSGYYTAGAATAGGAFVPITPTRLLDTRDGTEPAADESRTVAVTGQAGIPDHVAAVIADVGAFGSIHGGHVATGPPSYTGYGPIVSYFGAGQAVGNLLVIPVTSRTGTITVINVSDGPAQLYVDAVGYLISGQPATAGLSGPTGWAPVALDTRNSGPPAPVPAGHTVSATVVGAPVNVPAGASAVAVQVTVTNAKISGYVTAYPAGSVRPTTASLVFTAGRNMANTVLVPVGANNQISFYNGTAGPLDVVAQVVGFVGATDGPYTWTSPVAAFDDSVSYDPADCASATFCMVLDQDAHYAVWDGHELSAPMSTGLGTGTRPGAVSCPVDGLCTLTYYLPNNVNASATFRDGAWHAGPTIPPVPEGAYLETLSCTSASFCVAVGLSGGGTHESSWSFNGTRWTLESFPLNDGSPTVSCGSATLCLAADGFATAWYDGSTWRATTSGMANPQYSSCVSVTLCVAASFFHSQTFNRSVWGPLISTHTSGFATAQAALSCASASYCAGLFYTESGGLSLAYYDGVAWSGRAAIENPGSSTLVCRTTSFCAIKGGSLTVGTR